MPEFLNLQAPEEARRLLLQNINFQNRPSEVLNVFSSLGRIASKNVMALHPLPSFRRSSVDGYAVRARDSFGASDSMPGFLPVIGEVPMGGAADKFLQPGNCMLIHTGGMLPEGANAVIMLEYTQIIKQGEIEIQKSVADGENVIEMGEDVSEGQIVIPIGSKIRPAEIGGLLALGIQEISVYKKVRVGVISSGDELILPDQSINPGQIRDINSYTLAALISQVGGEPILYGIVQDKFDLIEEVAKKALSECEVVVITAGSSASIRDMTAEVISKLGKPGVLVHGINTRPGKPTILGVCDGKAIIGLPGNPVSALVNGYLFVVPVIEKHFGLDVDRPKPVIRAKLTINLSSQAGREDWQPVKLVQSSGVWLAEPVFGKSNLIFTLARADGLIKIHADANGITAGEVVDVILMN